jgi:hypothetical protein
MNPAGFPHSDALGSQLGCQLPEDYRRLQRPSSAPGAKASTVCPYQLDLQKQTYKMLASTVQFSNNGRNPAHTRRPPTPVSSPPKTDPQPETTGHHSPFPQDPTVCPPPPTPPPRREAGPGTKYSMSMFHTTEHHSQDTRPGRGPDRPHHPRKGPAGHGKLLRKEVIQPHLPVRLPCYDFVPIASPTFDSSLPQGVGPPASGVTDFRDVTGGVYKARERIHRSVADLRLLATPTSRGRVADLDPN